MDGDGGRYVVAADGRGGGQVTPRRDAKYIPPEAPRYEVRRCATDEVVSTHPTLPEAELARDLLLHTACPVYITWAY